ncbi:YwmB family TATA-box binding protein [Rossellomorea vietnamensis]|uniref:YwmB family TATA-box binding protein n=1 Tax=Rossellomorea vietnamensis TaxID=218284 RepID=UPI001CD024F7|nr:YwmB family TATA-box binding protein [Rossellomorea vietnamensis]MCA0151525.1 YwmB family TATA-box binding protein [Rossellomorea vietnamensis]
MGRYFYIILIFLVGLGFLPVINGNNTIVAKHLLDIEKLDQAIVHSQGQITEWSLYARENKKSFTNKGFAKYSTTMQETFSDFDWDTEKSAEGVVVVGQRQTSHGEETIKLQHTPTNGHSVSYIMYEMRGNQKALGEKTKQYIKSEFIPNMEIIFTSKPMIFSCIKGEFNDKLEKVLSNQAVELMSKLDAKELESLKEEDFYSISAYSEQMSRTIPTKNDDMNIQLGLRKSGMGAKTTFVIGTPILIIEY